MHILDGIGVALASTTMEDGYASKLLKLVQAFGGAPQCTIMGFGHRTAPAWAAFVNGSIIHGCEFDDVFTERILHTEGFAVPVSLALAEQRGLSGKEMIERWLITAEVALRAALGCAEDSLNHTGFHNTAIFGNRRGRQRPRHARDGGRSQAAARFRGHPS